MSEARETQPSRRCILRQAACAAGAVVILGTGVTTASAGKMPKSAVAYQPTPKGGLSCANCRLFEPPNGCKSVEGPVSGQGWCMIYVKV